MSNFDEFFKMNEVRIGEGGNFHVNPPVYYASLNEAFYSYFLTFREFKNKLHFIQDINSLSKEFFAFTFAEINSNIAICILSFHRFIELLLKDILRRINPFLAVRFLEKPEELFAFFNNKIDASEIRTTEYAEAFERLLYAFNFYAQTTDIHQNYLKDYQFLSDDNNKETLGKLTMWRNRIMHNGTTLPNLIAFEYLFSQRLIPLIDQILKAEKKYLRGYTPYYFETKTGINIIQEMLKIKFDYKDFKNKEKSEQLGKCFLKIGHLKEMGRTAYNQKPLDRGNMSTYENLYENPIGRAERFAETERKNQYFFSLTTCICCGANALVVYKKELPNIIDNNLEVHKWLKCYNCDYSLRDNVGDPHYFNLSHKPLFSNS
ncbi:hypothetical protein ACI6Q2_11725 [Chitinophagaceae bacterium LWZ2-11]